MFVERRGRYGESNAREAIAAASNWTEALRLLGMRPAGGNHATLKKWARRWGISTDHFDTYASRRGPSRRRRPIEEILVEHSTYNRGSLKRRLYSEGLKTRCCELCGQGEVWCGRRMSLILDHINGRADDNRIENLRIVCPNCAATLDTHCGRNLVRERRCVICSEFFEPRAREQRCCSLRCVGRMHRGQPYKPHPERRRADRPPFQQLLAEIDDLGYSATGRRYGVSDNAIRKWVRYFERELAAQSHTIE